MKAVVWYRMVKYGVDESYGKVQDGVDESCSMVQYGVGGCRMGLMKALVWGIMKQLLIPYELKGQQPEREVYTQSCVNNWAHPVPAEVYCCTANT